MANSSYIFANESFQVMPDTDYTIMIETDLGMGVKHQDILENVKTPSNYSALPYQLSEVFKYQRPLAYPLIPV